MNVVSVEPLVLHATNALDDGELRFFDDAGRQTKVFSSRQRRGTPALGGPGGGRDENASLPVRMVGHELVARLDDEFSDEHPVAGVDVRRVRWAWTSSLGTDDAVDMATGGDPGRAALFAEGGYSSRAFGGKERPHVLEVDPADGEVTNGDELDVGADRPEFYGASVFVVGHRVVVVRVTTVHDAPIITAYGQQ
ncbi:MAG: hypothetical protein J2P24_18725 [Streptosporangiales bacterium]|nr:hypothetical protein [Streptosporangiales bacterium]